VSALAALVAAGVCRADAPAPATQTAPRPAPALVANNCAPAGNLRGDAKRGAALHKENCAQCHGLDGKAQVIVLHMDTPPHDQTDVAYMKTLPDQFLYLAICRGGAAVGRSVVMPQWGDLFTDQDIRDLVAWIRGFSGT
jgi:cytochrome c oxidase cbb3-type subunit 3